MVYRSDDLDFDRCRPEFHAAALEDMRWIGLSWQEGPDTGGAHGPYCQSERISIYQNAFNSLRQSGWIYPCICSRRDVASAIGAPHAKDEEPFYPQHCRPNEPTIFPENFLSNWRFRIPKQEIVAFSDTRLGPQRAVAGLDFGDFLVWRKDGIPSYQLACAVDDFDLGITEVVRGADLVKSTFRQLLLFRALGAPAPEFYHAPLMLDDAGVRLAKRHDALSLRALREQGVTPAQIIETFRHATA
jgi:glutamyl-tRNA synthetase